MFSAMLSVLSSTGWIAYLAALAAIANALYMGVRDWRTERRTAAHDDVDKQARVAESSLALSDRLQTQLDRASSESDRKDEQIGKLVASAEQMRETIAAQETTVVMLKRTNTTLEERARDAERTSAALRDEIAALRVSVADLSARLALAESRLATRPATTRAVKPKRSVRTRARKQSAAQHEQN